MATWSAVGALAALVAPGRAAAIAAAAAAAAAAEDDDEDEVPVEVSIRVGSDKDWILMR